MKHKNKLLLTITLYINLICIPISSVALSSDFASPSKGWVKIQSEGHTGEQKLLAINNDNNNEKIYLYWMAPGAETQIQEHPQTEEVAIVQGSLYWLNESMGIQKKLKVGDYVDRKPGVKHGPFKAGPNGCLMYVRFH